MRKELASPTRCLLMRGGQRIYISEKAATQIKKVLLGLEGSRFIAVGGQIINTADLSGVFSMDVLGETLRTKRGDWQCGKCGKWLTRQERECSNCMMKTRYPAIGATGG